MKILFFIDNLSAGGMERRLTELMKGLMLKAHIEFELILLSREISYKEVLELNIPIHYILRKTKKDFSIFWKLFKVIKNSEPDILHCWGSMTAVYSAPICKLLNIKFVNGLITDAPEKQNIFNQNWFRAKLTFPFSDIIIGNSKAGLIAYNAPDKKSFFVHNGFNYKRLDNIIDREIIRNRLDVKTPYIIGMVANYSVNKDYKTFFTAAQILLGKRNDITFIAIGENTDSVISHSHISKHNIDHFKLLGSIDSVESYVNIMDICVLSTFTEGISNSILEYMSLGKPVIATSGGGTNEIVIDQETGFLVSRSKPEELAEKMSVLLDDKNLRSKMGVKGKEQVNGFFTIESMVDNYCALYNKTYLLGRDKMVHVFQNYLRELLGYLLIKIYFFKKQSHNGILSIYFHNPPKALFEKILIWLVAKGYKFISVKELENNINQKLNNEKLVFISFDDGWKGNLELIEAIERWKVPVAIFIPTDAIEDGNYWWEYSLIEGQQKYSGINNTEHFKQLSEEVFNEKIAILKKKYRLERSCITLPELRRMSENEFVTIGSHSVTHPILTNTSFETQTWELKESKRILSKWLHDEIEYISYPNGDYNEDTIEIAKKCTYKLGFTIHPGKIITQEVDPFMIPRNAIYDEGGYYENISKLLGIWQKFF